VSVATDMYTPAPNVIALPFDRQGWLAWLIENTPPNWRPDEWDSEHWLFTGDPEKAETATSRCDGPDCHVAVRGARSLCHSCDDQLLASGLSREEFVASGGRTMVRSVPGTRPSCSVERDGVRCAQESSTMGACQAHHGQWRYRVQRGLTSLNLGDWLRAHAEPRPVHLPCRVGACTSGATQRLPLCTYHRIRWHQHRKAIGLVNPIDADLDGWAAGQSPYLNGFQFSLIGLPELLRHELLYALVERDKQRHTLSPNATRMMIRGLAGVESIAALIDKTLPGRSHIDGNGKAHWNDIVRVVRSAFGRFRGIDPLDQPIWELSDLGLRSRTRSGVRVKPRQLDVTRLRQDWLRHLLADWVKETNPSNAAFRQTFEACLAASQALAARPGGGHDPGALKATDMDAVVTTIRNRQRRDGSGPLSYNARSEVLSSFCQLLDAGRRLQLLDRLASAFARQQHHTIPYEDSSEDQAGKAIPELVIAQLDAHTQLIGGNLAYGDFPPEAVQAMFRTIYILLRDTGRRPREVRWLRVDCLDTDAGEYVLIWDNHKSRRNRRRLEIGRQTAFAIQEWLAIRQTLKTPARSRTFLFPATKHGHDACIDADTMARMLRRWVDSLPELLTDTVDKDGQPLPFDRSRVFAYAFRHTYAQRHADAGTDLHTLRDLMDHKSADTTLGYFKVSVQRRRSAVETMRKHVVDRYGQPASTSSATAYEARSVAVPFGNCTEPSNVKAGGGKCPIRFQCSGCGFYRPDPSFLPAVEDHIRALKADRETARALDVAEFVVQNLTDQINSFQNVVSKIRTQLAVLPDNERRHLEEAAAVLRKTRVAAPLPLLPFPSIPARSDPR
jgi:integrase